MRGSGTSPSKCQPGSSGSFRIVTLAVIALCYWISQPLLVRGQTSVLTYHYDNARTGSNTQEQLLTPANVNKNLFGSLFSQNVDGAIVGQPLYLANQTIPGKGRHNVIYVATMHDSVYAFDADNNTGSNSTPLWHTSFLSAEVTTVPISVQGCGGTTAWTEVGVVSTPVIDPATGTIYVVAKTVEGDNFVHRLHALDVTTGLEKFGGPVKIAASFTSAGKTYNFADKQQVNRPGLLLASGNVYIAFGSNGCNNLEQGWVIAYNATTLQPEGAFDDEPGQNFAAIWQKGAGLSADASGNVYAETGDGSGPVIPGQNLGVSVLKLVQNGNTLSLGDYFTPYNLVLLATKRFGFDHFRTDFARSTRTALAPGYSNRQARDALPSKSR